MSNKTWNDLPYDCMGEIFLFLLDNETDFFSIYFLSTEMQSIVCKYTNKTYFNLKSTNFPNDENIYLAIRKLVVVCELQFYEKIKEYMKFVSRLKNLKSVTFIHLRQGFEILELLKKSCIINEIRFKHSLISNSELSILGKMKSIEKLELFCCPILQCMSKNKNDKISNSLEQISHLKLQEFCIDTKRFSKSSFLSIPLEFMKILNLSLCRFKFSEDIFQILKNSVIEELNLSGTKITDKVLLFLPKSLRILNLYMCEKIRKEGVKHLMNLPIENLNLGNISRLENFGSFLPRTIKNLNITSTRTKFSDLKGLSGMKIEKLDLSFNSILSEDLSFLPLGVKELKLNNCNLIGSLESISTPLTKSIENLNISNNFFYFDTKLSEFDNLKELNICKCKFGKQLFVPPSVRKLNVRLIKMNSGKKQGWGFLCLLEKIKELDLCSTDIVDSDLFFIQVSIENLKIKRCYDITEQGLKRFKKKRKNLKNLEY